jgi:transposase
VTSETICYRCVSLVGLPDVVILDVEDVPGAALRVHVELTRSTHGCPTCGVVAHVKDRRCVELVDLSMGGRAMRLVWVKRRFCCPESGSLVPDHWLCHFKDPKWWIVPVQTGSGRHYARRFGIVLQRRFTKVEVTAPG